MPVPKRRSKRETKCETMQHVCVKSFQKCLANSDANSNCQTARLDGVSFVASTAQNSYFINRYITVILEQPVISVGQLGGGHT